MAMSGLEGVASEGGFSTIATTSPLYNEGNSMEGDSMGANTSQSSSSSHHFNIETFDFGADFSLPTSLDELTIFQNQHNNSTGSGPNSNNSSSRSAGGPPSSDGISGSPHNSSFSPHAPANERRSHAGSGSRTESPHPLSMSTNDLSSLNSGGSSSEINNSDLHDLLMAVQNSSLPPSQQAHHLQHQTSQISQQEQHSTQESIMSLSELEKYLTDKEQSERMQNLQTAFLRQQLDSLRRQHHQAGGSQSVEIATPSTSNVNATQLMHQFQQLSSQQFSSTPTPHNPQYVPFSPHHPQPQQQHQQAGPTTFPSQSQKVDLSSMTQYGLVTPLSSEAFSHQGGHTFVSPIHLPTSSQVGMMEAHRAYDPHMVNGVFTPLESPAITPASVFSTVGSSTMTSQDMFSPLTSPALRPQMGPVHDEMMLPPSASPYHGPTTTRGRTSKAVRGKASPYLGPQGKKTTTPTASPMSFPTKSIPRKNRSTTAEARANRARTNSSVKPAISQATASTSSRKRTESIISANGFHNLLDQKVSNGTTSTQAGDQSAFPAMVAMPDSTAKPLDASPSETAVSTPSPIDLDGSSQGKPITPGSLMGIHPSSNKISKETNRDAKESESGKQVSFAVRRQETEKATGSSSALDRTSPTTSLQTIQPGGFPTADRETWMTAKTGGGLESRRTSHKAAEQKRRDSLKYCFDELRGMLPAITLDDDAPGGSSLGPDGFPEDQEEEEFNMEDVGDAESARLANRAISKVALLRHSNEYLIRLKFRLARRDADLEYCRRQIMELQSRLSSVSYPLDANQAAILGNHAPMNVDGS